MVLELSFITRTRDDLVAVSHMLADALTEEALSDPENPVLWSNWGGLDAGKSLISDMVVQGITGLDNVGFDHLNFEHEGRQFQFVDNDCVSRTVRGGKYEYQKARHLEKIKQQHLAGIFFLHNSAYVARRAGADIEINLGKRFLNPEAPYKSTIFNKFRRDFNRRYMAVSERAIVKAGLSDQFETAMGKVKKPASSKNWVRFVQIKIYNPAIFKPEFIRQARMVAAMDHAMRFGLEEAKKLFAYEPNPDESKSKILSP